MTTTEPVDFDLERLPAGHLVRTGPLLTMLGLTRSTLWRLRERGAFPAPMQIGGRTLAWRAGDLVDWLQSRRMEK